MKPVAIVGILIVVIIVIGGAYYLTSSSKLSGTTPTSQSTITQRSTSIQPSSSSLATTTVGPTTTINNSNSTSHYTITVQTAPSESYIANGTGETLYIYTHDSQNSGTSTCNGGCASAWPPFTPATLTLPTGFNSSQFKFITRTDGKSQLTFNGYPLYYYAGDSKPDQINGQGVGGFNLVSTSGQIIH